MWFERFVIIVTSLHRDFLPSSWGTLRPRPGWTSGLFVGSFGLFLTLVLLFCRFLPTVAIAETKAVLPGRPARGRPPWLSRNDAGRHGRPLRRPDALFGAAERVRDAGSARWDCHTPYPVHGLDRAMGLRPSPVPYDLPRGGLPGARARPAHAGRG